MKRILVPLLGDEGDRPALDLAAALARRRGAHIDAMLFSRDATDMIPLVGEGFNAAMIDSIVQAAEAQASERATAARATYASWREAAGVSEDAAGSRPSATFSTVTGHLPYAVALPARAADLVVFSRGKGDSSQERSGLIEIAMLESGRPVLLAASDGGGEVGRRVLVGWNGSAEAARAVAMTMPLLSTADAVTVLVVDDGDVTVTPDDLVRTLTLWGIAASGRTVKVSKEGVASTLEAEAAADGADMVLLGAYSHSRVREFVMGGVTDDALAGSSIAMLLAR